MVVERCASDWVMMTVSAASVISIANRTAFFLRILVVRHRCCLCCIGAQGVRLVCSLGTHWVVCEMQSVCATARHRSRRHLRAVFWAREKVCHPL